VREGDVRPVESIRYNNVFRGGGENRKTNRHDGLDPYNTHAVNSRHGPNNTSNDGVVSRTYSPSQTKTEQNVLVSRRESIKFFRLIAKSARAENERIGGVFTLRSAGGLGYRKRTCSEFLDVFFFIYTRMEDIAKKKYK